MKHRAMWTLASFAVGCVLCFWGVVLTGAGHGTSLPLLLCASPTIFAAWPHGEETAFLLGLFLAPVYWASLAWIATGNYSRRRPLLISLIVIQYVSPVLFLLWSDEDAAAFARMQDDFPFTVGGFVILYIVAHVLLWRSALRREHSLAMV